MPRGVVLGEIHGVWWRGFARLEVAVNRLEKRRPAREAPNREVGVQDVGVGWTERGQVERGIAQPLRGCCDQVRLGDPGARGGDQRHPMTECREPPYQGDDDALDAAVTRDREAVGRRDGDMHAR